MKINIAKITILAFVINFLTMFSIMVFVHSTDPRYLSDFKGIVTIIVHSIQDSLLGNEWFISYDIISSIMILVLCVLALKIKSVTKTSKQETIVIIILVYELLKIIPVIIFSGGENIFHLE